MMLSGAKVARKGASCADAGPANPCATTSS